MPAFINLLINGSPRPTADVKTPPNSFPNGKSSEKANVRADSQTIFEVDLYPGSPEPQISKRFSLPSSNSAINNPLNQPLSLVSLSGPSPGLGKKGLTKYLKGVAITKNADTKMKDVIRAAAFEG